MRFPLDISIEESVMEIYRQADAEIASAKPVCVASGKCCRFKEYDHTLFLSSMEAAVLLKYAPAYEKPTDTLFAHSRKRDFAQPANPGL
jgi:hypothetical protein